MCVIDGEPLFRTADSATAAVDALVRAGRLVEEGVDDHDVRKRYVDGPELVADMAGEPTRPPRRGRAGAVRARAALRRARAVPAAEARGGLTLLQAGRVASDDRSVSSRRIPRTEA